MNNMIKSFGESLRIIKSDKSIILLSLIPITIGILLYFLLGQWIYGDVYDWGKELIASRVESGWLNFLSGIFVTILSIFFFFVINWTFVIVVSFFASPFNDLISSRAERIAKGQAPPDISESFERMIKRVLHTFINEIKKVVFIIFVTLIGFAFSFFLPPVSLVISALLLAISFVDYSWSRHNLKFGKCLSDVKSNFMPYIASGGIFLIMVGIPLVNLFALPYSVIYYTVLFSKNQKVLEY
jgi:CysZ protein